MTFPWFATEDEVEMLEGERVPSEARRPPTPPRPVDHPDADVEERNATFVPVRMKLRSTTQKSNQVRCNVTIDARRRYCKAIKLHSA